MQPNQEELENIVDKLRRKQDENRRLARSEMSNASAVHTPNPSSPISRTCSPSQANAASGLTAGGPGENGSSKTQYHDDSRNKKKKHKRSRLVHLKRDLIVKCACSNNTNLPFNTLNLFFVHGFGAKNCYLLRCRRNRSRFCSIVSRMSVGLLLPSELKIHFL